MPGKPRTTSLIYGWTKLDRGTGSERAFEDFVKGAAHILTDSTGTEFIDARSTVWNVSFGHSQSAIAEAVASQMGRLTGVPTIDGQASDTAERLAVRLAELTGLPRVYLSLSGSSANEVAIAMARAYAAAKGSPGRALILSLDRGYHGQSIGTLPLAGITNPSAPAPEDLGYGRIQNCYCYRCPVGRDRSTCKVECIDHAVDQIERIGPERVAAVIIEPVQGSVGQDPPVEWFARLAAYLADKDILLIADEVANGFARLGADFGFQAFGFQPDILTLSKAITNGALPLAATLLSEKVADTLVKDEWLPLFGATQDGNPVCAAAALATLDILASQDWSGRARELGERLDTRLRAAVGGHPNVGDIRGMGLFRAVELVGSRDSKSPFAHHARFSEELKKQRLLIQSEGSVKVIAPPLTVSSDVIDEIADRFAAALRATCQVQEG